MNDLSEYEYDSRMYKVLKEEFQRLVRKYDHLDMTCIKCGKLGSLSFRLGQGRTGKRYFFCRHGDDFCYIARIEDIDNVLNPREKQARLS